MDKAGGERRPLRTRNAQWAQAAARYLAGLGVKPNWISLASVVFAGASGISMVLSVRMSATEQVALLLFLAAICIQLRLLCNLLDGLVAVEGGLKTKSGEVFNDFPDRIADAVILVAAGYTIPMIRFGTELGWLAGLLAVLTAYTRVLGGSVGLAQSFAGPMAKPHRMAVMTVALIVAALVAPFDFHQHAIAGGLAVVAVGSAFTVVRRVAAIIRGLEERDDA